MYGVLVLLPRYFLEARIGRDLPPAVTHPEHFYGFVGVALAWQVLFVVVAGDPVRFRPVMPVAVLEKLAFGVAAVVLFAQGRLQGPEGPDVRSRRARPAPRRGLLSGSPRMTALSRRVRRVLNGLRKVGAGLRPFGESVWPGVRNDLFVAHESIYRFAVPWARGAEVLDAGCGTGYGSRILADAGAVRVLGLDVDPLSVAFARRRYGGATLAFERADCQELALPPARFDLVFASNVLEHLERPERFLSSAFAALGPGGRALVAVPPITSAETAALHHGIHYHRSNLTVAQWHTLLSSLEWTVTAYAHTFAGPGAHPDFASPFPSVLSPSHFVFTPVSAEQLRETPAITAVFLAAKGS